MTKTIDEVKEELSLSKLEGGKLDVNQIIFRLNDRVNEVGSRQDISQPNKYNIFAAGIRLLQSNLNSKFNEEHKLYITYLTKCAEVEYDINEKINYQFLRLDTLHRIRDNTLVEQNYATLEGNTPGALSTFIANRISEKDSNFILMICGQPRSGKSTAALRLCYNVGKLTGREFTPDDIVYTHSAWLQRKEVRRSHKELKGSTQQIDEGQAMDSQNWFDTEVKEIVNHLRTQGADNTLTVIVSPLFPDIANKARGLVHAVLYPWKTWGKQYIELTDTGNIDYERSLSSWKLDFLDLEPMTGKTYPGKLKAALGNIIKVDFLMPNQSIINTYKSKSKKYKKVLQHNQLKRIMLKRLKQGDTTVYKELADQVIAEIDTYRKGKDGQNINMRRISRKFGIGRVYAEKVYDEVAERLGIPQFKMTTENKTPKKRGRPKKIKQNEKETKPIMEVSKGTEESNSQPLQSSGEPGSEPAAKLGIIDSGNPNSTGDTK